MPMSNTDYSFTSVIIFHVRLNINSSLEVFWKAFTTLIQMSFSKFYFWKAFINSLHFKSILVERDFCIHVHLFNAFQIKYANPKMSFIILFMILHVYNIWFFTTAWECKLTIHFIKHFVKLEKYSFL